MMMMSDNTTNTNQRASRRESHELWFLFKNIFVHVCKFFLCIRIFTTFESVFFISYRNNIQADKIIFGGVIKTFYRGFINGNGY